MRLLNNSYAVREKNLNYENSVGLDLFTKKTAAARRELGKEKEPPR